MDSYRLFIAIELPEEVKAAIEAAQAELRGVLPDVDVRWTRREQFHLTLRFLGNVPADRVEALTDAVRRACAGGAPMRLRAERIGFFPHMRSPRVIWVWVHDDAELLPKLAAGINEAAREFANEPAEKEFTGHVTFGRIERIQRKQADLLGKLALGMVDRQFGQWTANRVEIIRSELCSKGARYTTLAEVALGV